jgi:DsbC/DsbD-like thiol-disulfide interchange protein
MNVKQNSIHKISVIGRGIGLCLTLCALCTSLDAGEAQDLPKSFGGAVASVRLIAAAALKNGTYRTGVVIAMAPGSHTYWKQPGDAGVPPVFAFADSTNVTKADVLFPAPTRITEDGLDAFGYTDRVVFPVVVMPADPAKPSRLHVDLSYAVCGKICVPVHSTADIDLPAKGNEGDAIDAAFASVPEPLSPGQAGDLTVSPVAGAKKPTWTLSWTGAPPLVDVFAEAPDGYAFDTKPGAKPGTWMLVASQLAPAPTAKTVSVALTLAAHPQSFVTTLPLDVAKAP